MSPRLSGRVALITGAAHGIGRATAQRFREEGAHLTLVDRDAEGLAALAAPWGTSVQLVVADVAEATGAEAYVAAAEQRWGGLDILVANAGIGGPIQPLTRVSVEDFDHVYAVNVRGVWLGMRAAIPAMQRRGGGSIVVTSSYLGLRGVGAGGPYVASKHAITGLIKVAALEHARDNIRVNAVHPGMIETAMAAELERALSPQDPAQGRQKLVQGIPQRRYGQPEEIAELILFLASDAASYCTGSSFSADGGQTAR